VLYGRFLSATVSALAVTVACVGAASPARADTLADAIAAAYETNPGLQAQRAAMRALDESYVQARAAFGLQASISTTQQDYNLHRREQNVGGATVDVSSSATQAALTQELYTSGRYKARLAATEAQIQAARESLRRIEMDLLVRTTTAYVSVRRDEEILRISQQAVTFLAKQLQDTEDKYKVRQLTLTDVQQARARLAGAQTQLANSEGQLAATRAQYTSIIGRAPVDLAPEPDIGGLPENLDRAFDIAEQSNPSLLQAVYAEQGSRQRTAEARAQGLFTVAGRVDYRDALFAPYDARTRDSTITTSITVTQPLFSAGQISSGIRQALEENTRDQLLLDDARRQMILGVSQAWDQLVVSRRQLTTLEEEMKADTIALYGVREEESFALRSTIEILNAQAELQSAQINFARGRFSEYVGRVQLLANIGALEVSQLAPDVTPYDPVKNFNRVRNKGALPTDYIARALDAISLPMQAKPTAGDTTPLRPPSTVLPPAPVEAAKVEPVREITDLPNTTDGPIARRP
jgi:TolC family type I secretion outer membrane protein